MSAVLKEGGKPADTTGPITGTAERFSDLVEVESEYFSTPALILSDKNLDRMMDFAKIMATGKVTVPADLQNEGDCLAITMQALQWRMNPFAVAQKTHIIKGTLGYEAQLVNAVINSMAPTKDRIHYEWYGPWEKILGRFALRKSERGDYRVPDWKLEDEKDIGVKVWATLKGEDTPRVLELLLSQAATRNSTLWAEDPRQQLAYLGVKRWARLYVPDVILGVYTPDEVQQIVEREIGSGTTDAMEKPKAYTAEEFVGALAKAKQLVADGKKTPEEIISTIRAKRPITAEQEKEIRALKMTEPAKTETTSTTSQSTAGTDAGAQKNGNGNGAPVVTYAVVRDKLEKATKLDILDAHADLIAEVADETQRGELSAFYKERRAALGG